MSNSHIDYVQTSLTFCLEVGAHPPDSLRKKKLVGISFDKSTELSGTGAKRGARVKIRARPPDS